MVGSGPNGLSAAIELARAGRSVLVLEGATSIGGGARTAEVTLPGFHHDLGSAVHPLAIGSPFLRQLPLAQHGLEWVQPEAPLAHPLDDGTAPLLERSIAQTMEGLGQDGRPWADSVTAFATAWPELAPDLLAPLHWPRHPLLLVRLGLRARHSAARFVKRRFEGERARALFAGLAAHSSLTLQHRPSTAIALVLAIVGHAVGWPVPRGGAQRISDALAGHLRSLGGEIETDARVRSLRDLPTARLILLDLAPRGVLRVAGGRLPDRYRRRLERFRYGPGVFKMDWALDGPIPWQSAACARAGTVHVGGGLEEVSEAVGAPWRGEAPASPFLILAQPTLFDPSRAPAGKHIAWAYCHVPNGSTVDMADRMEAQIERFAPGFRDLILARHVLGPRDLERANPNLVGGDIGGGANVLGQLFFRPARRLTPYSTPVKGLYICSSSTPPGVGVHGMCGFQAARAALQADR